MNTISPRSARIVSAIALVLTVFVVSTSALAEPWITVPARQPADVPSPKVLRSGQIVPRFLSLHNRFKSIAAKGNGDLVFLGDSITRGWVRYAELFQAEFQQYRPLNFGMNGNRTQNVLWRVQNGELNGLSPKIVVLMIGTNNVGPVLNTPAQIASGILAIISEIHHQSPSTRVLLLSILPRASASADQKNVEVNALISQFADGDLVHYLDLRPSFLTPEGALNTAATRDGLHLNGTGYQLWADAMREPLAELMR
jgi:lysophospholipase L1-like esterase